MLNLISTLMHWCRCHQSHYSRIGLQTNCHHLLQKTCFFNEARDEGINWTTYKQLFPLWYRQITTPRPHHSNFFCSRCFSWHPTNNVKEFKADALKCVVLNWKSVILLLCKLGFVFDAVEGLSRYGGWWRLYSTDWVEDCVWHHSEGQFVCS